MVKYTLNVQKRMNIFKLYLFVDMRIGFGNCAWENVTTGQFYSMYRPNHKTVYIIGLSKTRS